LDELFEKFQWYARLFPQPRYKDKMDYCVKVFIHLMFQGQVCSAVQSITDRIHGGGVLTLNTSTRVPEHSVLDMLHM